jgi:RimJ/RimL family protein N-acetyltransferase
MGQICVGKAWRGQGVFDLLYRAHRRYLREAYDFCITEVATRNVRSMRAHQRVGFTVIDRYRDATDEWALLRWDWSTP